LGDFFDGKSRFFADFLLTAPTDAHTALLRRALSGLLFDAISLSLNKEMAKENQPRGSPLGTPSARQNC
jgi:hypothetical protein